MHDSSLTFPTPSATRQMTNTVTHHCECNNILAPAFPSRMERLRSLGVEEVILMHLWYKSSVIWDRRMKLVLFSWRGAGRNSSLRIWAVWTKLLVCGFYSYTSNKIYPSIMAINSHYLNFLSPESHGGNATVGCYPVVNRFLHWELDLLLHLLLIKLFV